MSYIDKELEESFAELNAIYSDVECVNCLKDLVGDNLELKYFVVNEVETYNYELLCTPPTDAKNRTTAEGDSYFKDLVKKLSIELRRRGMHKEAMDILSMNIGELPNKRMTEAQYIRSLREPRIAFGLKCGLNKTNAKALSLIIEQLCGEVYK